MGKPKTSVGQADVALKKTAATKAAGEASAPSDFDKSRYQRNLFFVMAANMSWQLALVVIIPIVGGYYLDQFFHTFPGLLIAGLLLATLGVVLVMIRTLNEANRRTGAKK